jgi:AraC family transcriptional regulator
LTHAILACRTSGSSTVARRSSGTLIRRRPTIGSVTYVAPDTPALYVGEGHCEVCHIYLSQQALRRFADDTMSAVSVPRIRDLFAVEDPWLKGYFQMLISEFELCPENRQHADALFITQAEHLLIHHLMSWHSDATSKDSNVVQRRSMNALRSVTLKRVHDYIAANLADNIRLPDLATISCMSVGHFVRAFRNALGTTPYDYVLEQRVRKASFLLRTTTLPISALPAIAASDTVASVIKFRARRCNPFPNTERLPEARPSTPLQCAPDALQTLFLDVDQKYWTHDLSRSRRRCAADRRYHHLRLAE